jgi:hypothetical protein
MFKFSSWANARLLWFTVIAWAICAIYLLHEKRRFDHDAVYRVSTTHYRSGTPTWTNVNYKTSESLAAEEDRMVVVYRIIGIACLVAGAASAKVLVERQRRGEGPF